MRRGLFQAPKAIAMRWRLLIKFVSCDGTLGMDVTLLDYLNFASYVLKKTHICSLLILLLSQRLCKQIIFRYLL